MKYRCCAALGMAGGSAARHLGWSQAIGRRSQKAKPGEQRARKGREALNKFMTAIAGNRAELRRATRALFAPNHARFEELIADWPEDIRAHLLRVLEDLTDAECGARRLRSRCVFQSVL